MNNCIWCWRRLALAALTIVSSSSVAAEVGAAAWVQRYRNVGSANDLAYKVATDFYGNSIVAGETRGSAGPDGIAIIKYSTNGLPLWTNRYSSSEFYGAMALDAAGNIYVTGLAPGNYDFITIAYSATGTPLWTNRYNGGYGGGVYGGGAPIALRVDGSSNVFVAGYSYGPSSGFDFATIAYSAAGFPLWTNRYHGPNTNNNTTTEELTDLAVDAEGNTYITGFSNDTNGHSNYATLAYDINGLPLWTNRYDAPTTLSQSQQRSRAVWAAGFI